MPLESEGGGVDRYRWTADTAKALLHDLESKPSIGGWPIQNHSKDPTSRIHYCIMRRAFKE